MDYKELSKHNAKWISWVHCISIVIKCLKICSKDVADTCKTVILSIPKGSQALITVSLESILVQTQLEDDGILQEQKLGQFWF